MHTHTGFVVSSLPDQQISIRYTRNHPRHSPPCRFLIGREKPGTQSEVARLISETLEQERQQQVEDTYEQSTEEVSHTSLGLFAYVSAYAQLLGIVYIELP